MNEFAIVAVFLFGGLIAAGALFIIQSLLSPKRPSPTKLSPYECGEVPIGDAQIRFNFRFFIFAVLFVIFEVEAAFLFPWAVNFREFYPYYGAPMLWEMVLFVGILFIGWFYAYEKGALKWE